VRLDLSLVLVRNQDCILDLIWLEHLRKGEAEDVTNYNKTNAGRLNDNSY
jgi:hypothetical protein